MNEKNANYIHANRYPVAASLNPLNLVQQDLGTLVVIRSTTSVPKPHPDITGLYSAHDIKISGRIHGRQKMPN